MDSTSQSFTQLADKSLTADIKIATWCPTMDLLALATADGQLCLHRLNWQRLWAISPESLVTSLCWRPDGKVLACGHEDGFISLLNVENGEAQQRGKMVAGLYLAQYHDQGRISAQVATDTRNLLIVLQALRQQLAGLRSMKKTLCLMTAFAIKRALPGSVTGLSPPLLPQAQHQGLCMQAKQTIHSHNGLCCQRGST